MKTEFKLAAIGQVQVAEDGFCLALDEAYRPALMGLDGFCCLNVLWWANLLDTEEHHAFVTCAKPYKHGPVTLGTFATLSPLRPTPKRRWAWNRKPAYSWSITIFAGATLPCDCC